MSEAVSAETKPKNKGGRPRNPVDAAALVNKTPELKAYIDNTITAAVERIAAQLAAGRGPEVAAMNPAGDQDWASKLAVALQQVASPGKKPIDPAEQVRRDIARERMEALIIQARSRGHVPHYKLITAVFLDEVLVQPTERGPDNIVRNVEIGWPLVPNESMRPVDWSDDLVRRNGYENPAFEIWEAFMHSIGAQAVEPRAGTEAAAGGNLKVLQNGRLESVRVGTPTAGQGAGSGNLRILSAPQGGVVSVPVLGTVASPARQLA